MHNQSTLTCAIADVRLVIAMPAFHNSHINSELTYQPSIITFSFSSELPPPGTANPHYVKFPHAVLILSYKSIICYFFHSAELPPPGTANPHYVKFPHAVYTGAMAVYREVRLLMNIYLLLFVRACIILWSVLLSSLTLCTRVPWRCTER